MLAWLRDLTSRERRTMLACWGGWTLDGFDQQLYSYVVPTRSKPSLSPTRIEYGRSEKSPSTPLSAVVGR